MRNYSVNNLFWAVLFLTASLFAQNDLSLTVTNSDMGLVRESRVIDLQKGKQSYLLTDIPEKIDPTSVLIESKNNSFIVLEQNFEYDLISVDKVLEKSVDQKIWLVDPEQGMLSGRLLSGSDKYLMLLDDEGNLQIIPKNDRQKVILKDYASQKEKFITKPTLVWKVEAQKAGKHSLTLSYLTRGLNWRADYVGKLSADDKTVQLACWVTINNQSGKVYNNARLKLMAGDLHLIKEYPRKTRPRRNEVMALTIPKRFEEKAFFEYYLYTLQGKTTLLNNQVKQIQLFPETRISVKKKYIVNSYNPNEVTVKITFKNLKKNNLGIALPAGKVRIYKEDQKELEFIGEDRIKHTPRDEEVKLTIGKAFDLVSERNRVKTERVSKTSEKRVIEYRLRNHKKQDVTIEVIENIPAYKETKLISSNIKPKEVKAGFLKFEVLVKAGQETRLEIEYLIQ
ncbi:MAG: DUF4139 domain-containing protein [Calditrichaeota bacterium]|nr:DUF4139 domain-containing protein [Calditrichota bacterium]